MDPAKSRLDLPVNQQFYKKALAVLAETLRRKLESGEHGTVAVELDVGDGNVRGVSETSKRWWNAGALTKY